MQRSKLARVSFVLMVLALLFALSLLPFTTSYLGRHFLEPSATALYAASLVPPALTYLWLQSVIARTGSQSAQARAYHRATGRKALAGSAGYALAALLSWKFPAVGVTIPVLIALVWIKPWSRIDSVFLRCDGPDSAAN